MAAPDAVEEERVVEVDVKDRTFNLARLVDQITLWERTVVIKSNGKVIAVVISPADFKILCQAKDSDESMQAGTD